MKHRMFALLAVLLVLLSCAFAEEYTDDEGNRFVTYTVNGNRAKQRYSPDGGLSHEWQYYPDGQLYHEIWYEGGEITHHSYWYYGTGGADALYIAFNEDGSLRGFAVCAYDADGILQTCDAPLFENQPLEAAFPGENGTEVSYFFDEALNTFVCRYTRPCPDDPTVTILCTAANGGSELTETWLRGEETIRVRTFRNGDLLSDTEPHD